MAADTSAIIKRIGEKEKEEEEKKEEKEEKENKKVIYEIGKKNV